MSQEFKKVCKFLETLNRGSRKRFEKKDALIVKTRIPLAIV